MSLYQRGVSGPWQYEFVLHGKRYRGSTGTTSKPAALTFEAQKRQDIGSALWAATEDAAAAVQHTTMWDAAQSWLNKSAAEMADHKGNLGRVRKLFGREMLLIRGEWVEVKSERFGFSKTLQVHEVTHDVLEQLRDTRKAEGNSPSTASRELALVRELIKRASDMHNPSMTMEAAPLHPYVHIGKFAARKLEKARIEAQRMEALRLEVLRIEAQRLALIAQTGAFLSLRAALPVTVRPPEMPRFFTTDTHVLGNRIRRLSRHMRRVLRCRYEVCSLGKHWGHIEAITLSSIDRHVPPVLLASVCLGGSIDDRQYSVFDGSGVVVPHASKLPGLAHILRAIQVTVCAWTSWEPRNVLEGYHDAKRAAAVLALPKPPKTAKVRPRRVRHTACVNPQPPMVTPTASTTSDTTPFTDTQRASIEALRLTLSRRVSRALTADYGSDEGQHWAALCVKSLPLGSFGRPGPLVSILKGAGVRGPTAVMGADGSAIEASGDFDEAVKTACFAGIRTYRGMAAGAAH